MKLETIIPALAPIAIAILTHHGLGNIINATLNSPSPLPLTITLAPNATEALKSRNLWSPDAEFLDPDATVVTVNCTVEARKFAASGLDVNELVRVIIDNKATGGLSMGPGGGGGEGENVKGGSGKDCTRCGTCQKACFGTFWFLPLYAM